MDLLKVILFAAGCLLLGIVGGIVARSWFAGVVVGLFVFIGWILWRLFKSQQIEVEKSEDTQEES